MKLLFLFPVNVGVSFDEIYVTEYHTVIDLEEAALSLKLLYAFCADFAKSSASSALIKNTHNTHLSIRKKTDQKLESNLN